MSDVRVFVMDNSGNIYHISNKLVGKWERWKYFEGECMLNDEDEFFNEDGEKVKVDKVFLID